MGKVSPVHEKDMVTPKAISDGVADKSPRQKKRKKETEAETLPDEERRGSKRARAPPTVYESPDPEMAQILKTIKKQEEEEKKAAGKSTVNDEEDGKGPEINVEKVTVKGDDKDAELVSEKDEEQKETGETEENGDTEESEETEEVKEKDKIEEVKETVEKKKAPTVKKKRKKIVKKTTMTTSHPKRNRNPPKHLRPRKHQRPQNQQPLRNEEESLNPRIQIHLRRNPKKGIQFSSRMNILQSEMMRGLSLYAKLCKTFIWDLGTSPFNGSPMRNLLFPQKTTLMGTYLLMTFMTRQSLRQF